MSTSKHRRKSGAVTVKKYGKIVGNIGSGKAKVPTVSKKQTFTSETSIIVSPIASRSKTFKTLNAVTENNNHSKVDKETLQVLWNISKGQSMEDRIHMLSSIMDSISFDEQKSFIENLPLSPQEADDIARLFDPKKDISRTLPTNIINLLAYVKNNIGGIKIYVAGNEKMLPETLVYLSNDESTFVRSAVAANKNTPPKILAKLSKERNNTTRIRIAKNPNTPHRVLRYYSGLKSDEIKEMVALNPSITPGICRNLAKVFSLSVKMNLIANKATPDDVLEDLINYPERGEYYKRVIFSAEQELERRREAHNGDI